MPTSVEAGNVYLDTPARPLSDVANKDFLAGVRSSGQRQELGGGVKSKQVLARWLSGGDRSLTALGSDCFFLAAEQLLLPSSSMMH